MYCDVTPRGVRHRVNRRLFYWFFASNYNALGLGSLRVPMGFHGEVAVPHTPLRICRISLKATRQIHIRAVS